MSFFILKQSLKPLASLSPVSASAEQFEALEALLLGCEQAECKVTHHFSPGVYSRELFVPAGSLVMGHEHREECMNILLEGRIAIQIDGEYQEMKAPQMFKSRAGLRKLAYIFEDMRFLTIHATDETDPERLEDLLCVKSPTWREAQKMIGAGQ